MSEPEDTPEFARFVKTREEVRAAASALLVNALGRAAGGGEGGLDRPGRDLDAECGHPKGGPSPAQYEEMYRFNTLGRKAVHALADECWQSHPEVYEDDDPEKLTPAEQDWAEVLRLHPAVWRTVHRADRLSGVGRYGGLVLGVDDGRKADEPLGAARNGPRSLLYLRPVGEREAEVSSTDTDPTSVRFGRPTSYLVQVGDPDGDAGTTEVEVHWTRFLHMADELGAGEVYAPPRLEPVFNRLLDLRKTLGASAEMFYKGAFPGISFEVLAELAGRSNMDKASLRAEFLAYQNGTERFMALDGATANTLAPNVADPTQHAMLQVQMIAADLDVPVRVLLGSQQGHLAGLDDTHRWEGKVTGRRADYLTPAVVVGLADRLAGCGVVRPPAAGFKVWWPEVDLRSPQEKADTAVKTTQALMQYVTGGAEVIFPLPFYLSEVLRLPARLVRQIVDAAGAAENTQQVWQKPAAGGPKKGDTGASKGGKQARTSRNGLGGGK